MKAHAIVIGGSIAGMLAARVLSDHFERVTLLDRDALPDSPEPRKGAPQTAHVHVLLRRGLLIMRQLFPQLDADLTQAGALTINWTRDLVTFTPAGWNPRFDSDFTTRTVSRGLLEQLTRRRVVAIKNITIEPRCEALELVSTADRSAVTGLKVRYRDRVEKDVVVRPADLIVDASGRSSPGLEWIDTLGYAGPEETVINAHVGYATRVYRRPANFTADWKTMMVRTRPPYGLRGGLIYPIENDLWMVNVAGAGDERPPTDEDFFLDFIKHFIHPALYLAVKDAEPVAGLQTYQRTENRLRHFNRLARWPDHFVMLGDAACAFNPTYGQGMTVAALEAQLLDRWLRVSKAAWNFRNRSWTWCADPGCWRQMKTRACPEQKAHKLVASIGSSETTPINSSGWRVVIHSFVDVHGDHAFDRASDSDAAAFISAEGDGTDDPARKAARPIERSDPNADKVTLTPCHSSTSTETILDQLKIIQD